MKYGKSFFMMILGIFRKIIPGKRSPRAWLTGLLATCVAAFGSCNGIAGTKAKQAGDAEEMKTLTIATWNVQALFDGKEDGIEYPEYRMTAGWSEEKYQARLTSLAEAAAHITEGIPDILALQEAENETVLRNLVEGPLAKYGYNWTFFANNPGSPLGVGLLSRLPLLETKVHSITWNGDTSPRPIAEVWLEAEKTPMALFICHWKSKVEGEDITEPIRRASARVILRRLREIEEKEPDLPVIILGDLNENHDEFYRRSGSVVSALLPDDPVAAEFAALKKPADFLVISGQKPPQPHYFARETAAFYSPWKNELEKGSYRYKGEWETLDHFLLSKEFFDGQGWEFDACEAPHWEPFINDRGMPWTYNPRTGNGLSDHLPLLLKLKRAD
jgi:endonuclease/exonuclease/phosphatase family metal-dependent hydrolase